MIRLPRGPVTALTKIEYIDAAGTLQTMDEANYIADLASLPARIAPADSWPATKDQPAAVKITYDAGNGQAQNGRDDLNIPSDIRMAIIMLAGHYFENPEGFAPVELRDVPLSIRTIIEQSRIPEAAP